MLVKSEARILIFPGTDCHFPSTSVPPGTFFRLWLFTDIIFTPIVFLRRWRGSVWFIISERNSLLFTPVSSLIDTRLFTVYTRSLQYRSTRSTSVLITFTSQHANPHRPQHPIIA